MHRRFGARQQRMPVRQPFSFRQQAIRAGMRQPFKSREIVAGQLDAVRLVFETALVVAALTGFDVQLLAGDISEVDFVGVFVHQLMQAALPAAVTQRFPLHVGHFVESFALPERDFAHKDDVHTSKESAPYNESGTWMQVLPPINSGNGVLQHAGLNGLPVKTNVEFVTAGKRADTFRRTGEDHIARFEGKVTAHIGDQRQDFVDHV
ncbi:hypothetical protein D3C85_1324200 [compost metagenome]